MGKTSSAKNKAKSALVAISFRRKYAPSESSLLPYYPWLVENMNDSEKSIIEWLSRESEKLRRFDSKLDLDDKAIRSLIGLFSRIAIENPIPLFIALLSSEKMQERIKCPECGGSGKYEGRWDCLFCRESDHTIANYELALRSVRKDS